MDPTEVTHPDDEQPGPVGPVEPGTEGGDRRSTGPLNRLIERSRFLVVFGSLTGLVLAVASFSWAFVKALTVVRDLLPGGRTDEFALVKLFESMDVVLTGTVLLIISVGLWDLFIADLRLPPALTMKSLDDLKAKVATTLLLVLVVRFLEIFVSGTDTGKVLELAVAVTLVGSLLMVFANWRR